MKATIFVTDLIIKSRKEQQDTDEILTKMYEDSKELWEKIYEELPKEYSKGDIFSFTDLLNNDLLTIDFEFAKQLNLFDAITANCFEHKDVLGKELKDFLNENNIVFFVAIKYYKSKEDIEIIFKMSDQGEFIYNFKYLLK